MNRKTDQQLLLTQTLAIHTSTRNTNTRKEGMMIRPVNSLKNMHLGHQIIACAIYHLLLFINARLKSNVCSHHISKLFFPISFFHIVSALFPFCSMDSNFIACRRRKRYVTDVLQQLNTKTESHKN